LKVHPRACRGNELEITAGKILQGSSLRVHMTGTPRRSSASTRHNRRRSEHIGGMEDVEGEDRERRLRLSQIQRTYLLLTIKRMGARVGDIPEIDR